MFERITTRNSEAPMRTFQLRFGRASLLVTASMLLCAAGASAQFGRGYDPYNPTSSGGFYVPGTGTRYVFPVGPPRVGQIGRLTQGSGPISVVLPLGSGVYTQWPLYPGTSPISLISPAGDYATALYPGAWPRGVPFPTTLTNTGSIGSANTTASGYRTGGAYASPTQSRSMMPSTTAEKSAPIEIVLPDRPAAAAAEQPRNAFNKWKNQRDRQAQPDPVRFGEDELNRNLTQPELKDVISGASLNVVLQSLISMGEKLKKTAPIVIEEDTLKRLNFTRGTGSIGVLRDEGRIAWPEALQAMASIAPARQEIETRFAGAYEQVAKAGRSDLATLDDLLKRVDQLVVQIAASEKPLTFAENVAAKRFVASLEDSIRFLKQVDAAEWLPGKCKLKPTTVQELVQIMADKKIQFAPALVGNDNIYISTHLMLVRVHKQATLNR
jgi:hypothetical protein